MKFSKALKNFSFAAQRFNSLTDPLFKIFHLLPEVLAFLSELTRKGDADDAKWATHVLQSVTGKRAWFRIMVAAMAGDAMMLCHKFIRKDDSASTEVYFKASEAGCGWVWAVRTLMLPEFGLSVSFRQVQEVLQEIRVIFKNEAILHDEGAATLTALTLRNLSKLSVMTYWQGRSQVACGIPEGNMDDLRPVAREICELFEAFFATNFPAYEEVNAYAALRLDGGLTWPQRQTMLQTIAMMENISPDDLWNLGHYSARLCFKGRL